ncbi:MAG TPA: restriction endonuclease, partial [Candidatus Binatus sp.]|nr:restriction endonuclease [Candidatus Binatus sp.]
MAAQPMNRPLVVDMVCDVCRIEGFQIERDSEDHDQLENKRGHVAVIATRQEGENRKQVAFECSETDQQIDTLDIERFRSRLRALGISNGVYVSPKGFTGSAEFIARKMGIELWDLSKLKERFEKIIVKEKTRVPSTLPVSRALPERILSSHLENGRILKPLGWPRLEYRPYYFAEFSIQGKKRNLSGGVLVFDGVDGRACDATMYHGTLEGMPMTGFFVDCLEIEPSTGSLPELPQDMEMKDTVTVAAAGVGEDVIRSNVPKVLREDSNVDPETVKVSGISLLHIPIVTVELGGEQIAYKKIVQATTGRVI